MEPLNSSAFGKADFVGHVSKTIDYRSPRLVVMECPTKHWITCTKPKSYRTNAARQKRKTIREAITSWLTLAEQVSAHQVAEGRDFVIETPLTNEVLNHPAVKRLVAENTTCLANTDVSSSGKCRATWWLTSSTEIAQSLNLSLIHI